MTGKPVFSRGCCRSGSPVCRRLACRPYPSTVISIDPEQLRLCLQVLSEVESLPSPEHPDAVAVRLATAGIFKAGQQRCL